MNRPMLIVGGLLVVGIAALAVVLSLSGPASPERPGPEPADTGEPDLATGGTGEPDLATGTGAVALPASGEAPAPAPMAGGIRGIVLSEEKESLAGVSLVLTADVDPDFSRPGSPFRPGESMRMEDLIGRTRTGRWSAEAESGDDGRFVVRPAGPAPYRLTARLAGYGTKVTRELADEGSELVVVLLPGVKIRGTVVSDDDGEPIAGAEVATEGIRAFTGDEGAFELVDVAAGKVELRLRAAAYEPATVMVEVEAGGTREGVAVALAPGSGILGIVQDPQGDPVKGADVQALSGSLPSDRARTDSRGRFALGGLSPGTYALRASTKDLAPAVREGVRLEEGGRVTGIVLELREEGVVTGVILGAAGEPISGARVRVTAKDRPGGFVSRMIDRVADRSERTGADGRYRVGGLGAGTYRLEAEADGHMPAESEPFPVVEGESATVDLTLETGLVVTGRVSDRRGNPVEGAVIEPARDGMNVFANLGGGPSATSRKDGTFVLAGMGSGAVDVTAKKDGYAPATLAGVRPGEGEVTFVLGDLGSLGGRVLDAETGEAVEIFKAEAMSASAGVMGMGAFRASGNVEMLGDGYFRITNLAAGPYNLSIYADAFAPGRSADLEVREGEETGEIVVLLDRGQVLAGTVVSAATGAPVSGAEVRADLSGNMILAMTGAGENRTGQSDDNGRFLLTGLQEGTTNVRISHPEFADQQLQSVRVPAEKDLVIELFGGGTVVARVFEIDGTPVLGAMVILQRNAPFTQMMGTSDEKGVVTFERVPPGSYFLMKMDLSGGARRGLAGMDMKFKTVTVDEGQTEEIELRDEGGSTVRGRVFRGDEPVAGAMVYLMGGGEGAQALEGMKFGVTGADGAYELKDVPPGEHTVAVSSPGNFTPGHSEKVVVEAGRDASLDLHLALATITGRVEDESGKGLAGVRVVAVPAAKASFRAGQVSEAMEAFGAMGSTGADGIFSLKGIQPGEYVIRAWLQGHASVYSPPVTVPELGAGPGDVRIVLPAGSEVTVKVRRSDGSPLSGAWVFATDSEGRTVSLSMQMAAVTDTEGVAVLKLAPGEYRIEIQGPKSPAVFASVRVSGGADQAVAVDVPAAGRLEIQVTAADGQAVPGVRVDLFDEAGRPVIRRATGDYVADAGDRTRTDEAGAISYPLLAPGTYRIQAKADDGRTAQQSVRIAAGGLAQVNLALE